MRLLVAVDGSTECEACLGVATKWADVLRASVYLLQVLDDLASKRRRVNHGPRCVGCAEAEVLAMKRARTYLDGLASRYGLPADSTRCLVCPNNDAVDEIITIAETKGVDLIVVSSRCWDWREQRAPGSVGSEVASSSACPVLCVPPSAAEVGRRASTVASRQP